MITSSGDPDSWACRAAQCRARIDEADPSIPATIVRPDDLSLLITIGSSIRLVRLRTMAPGSTRPGGTTLRFGSGGPCPPDRVGCSRGHGRRRQAVILGAQEYGRGVTAGLAASGTWGGCFPHKGL